MRGGCGRLWLGGVCWGVVWCVGRADVARGAFVTVLCCGTQCRALCGADEYEFQECTPRTDRDCRRGLVCPSGLFDVWGAPQAVSSMTVAPLEVRAGGWGGAGDCVCACMCVFCFLFVCVMRVCFSRLCLVLRGRERREGVVVGGEGRGEQGGGRWDCVAGVRDDGAPV